MKLRLLTLFLPLLLVGCNMQTNEERELQVSMGTFVHAIQANDENAAKTILLDLNGFQKLNPDVGARTDASSFTEAVLDDLVSNFRGLVTYFNGKQLVFKSCRTGGQWYQYKGFSAFRDNVVTITVDGEEVQFTVKGLVRIEDKWRIVDLTDNGLL